MMRGRPRLVLDSKKLLELKAQGLSYRKIAKSMEISHTSVNSWWKRTGKELEKNWKRTRPANLEANTTVLKPTIPATLAPDKTTTPTTLELGVAHHLLWTGTYVGKQPISSETYRYGTNDCNFASVYHRGDITLRIHLHRFEIYCNKIIGDTTEEMKGKAYGKARELLRDIAIANDLAIDYAHIERKWELHINFTKTHQESDKLVLGMVQQEPARARDELGILAGDRSHPGQTEFVGDKGGMSFDALSFAIKQLPVLASHIGEYNENIRTHMEAIRELRDAVRELREEWKRRK
jgi:hypothetical protein